MKIVTAVFDYPGVDTYERCLRAMSNSIKATNPKAELNILRLDPPEPVSGAYQGWVNNHIKLDAYSRVVLNDYTIFADVDTVFLQDASKLFNTYFDVGIGRRPPSAKVKYNGGVVLMQPTDSAREFMENWIQVDADMLHDQKFHKPWHAKYNGQNQASFGYMIETYPGMITLKEYPTDLVNAVEQDWPYIGQSKPVILHVRKQLLRNALTHYPLKQIRPHLREAVKIWREYETR